MNQNNFKVLIHKTDKIKVDKESHSLPPSNGTFREFKVADYFCPDAWSKDAVFIPVKEGQPMWFDLQGNGECACVPSIQRLNPVTGDPANLDEGLTKDPEQNYLALPGQRWIDGYAKDGKVYQFVVTKQGEGLAVSEYVLPKHMQDSHAIGFAFFAPKNPKPKVVYRSRWVNNDYLGGLSGGNPTYFSVSKGRKWGSAGLGSSSGLRALDSLSGSLESFGSIDQSASADCSNVMDFIAASNAEEMASEEVYEEVDMMEGTNLQDLENASMGMGGRIDQEIKSDDNTIEYYHEKPDAVLTIYFALPDMFKAIMDKGKKQDKTRHDKYKMSGEVGGVQVPLMADE